MLRDFRRTYRGGGGSPPFLHNPILHTLGPTQHIQHTIHGLITPQAWSYTKLVCMTPTTDPTRGVSAHASIQHATIPHSPQFTKNGFHTSTIQHNPFLLLSFSTEPVSNHQFLTTKLVLHHRSPFLHTNLSQVGKVGRRYGLPTRFPQVDIFSFKVSAVVWHGSQCPYTYSQINNVDIRESLDKVVKAVIRVNSFVTLSRDSLLYVAPRASTLFI